MDTNYESMFKKISRMLNREEEKEESYRKPKSEKEVIKDIIRIAHKGRYTSPYKGRAMPVHVRETVKRRDFYASLAHADGLKKELFKYPQKYENWEFERECNKVTHLYEEAENLAGEDTKELRMVEKRLSRFGDSLIKYAEKVKEGDKKYTVCLERAKSALKEGYNINENIKGLNSLGKKLKKVKRFILNE